MNIIGQCERPYKVSAAASSASAPPDWRPVASSLSDPDQSSASTIRRAVARQIGAFVLPLLFLASGARADETRIFSTPGGYSFTAPATTSYEIYIAGAQGGGGAYYNQSGLVPEGGLGAVVGGIFNLNAGDKLILDVGEMGGVGRGEYVPSPNGGFGQNGGGGGGGGGATWVQSDTALLLIAGGGGGAGIVSSGLPGVIGFIGLTPAGVAVASFAQGGPAGAPFIGRSPNYFAYGGGGGGTGYSSPGGSGAAYGGKGGNGYLGGQGGINQDRTEIWPGVGGKGGYGGGGGGDGGTGGGGGGGGFTGGYGGTFGPGGGGGSFNASTSPLFGASGIHRGDGAVFILYNVPGITTPPYTGIGIFGLGDPSSIPPIGAVPEPSTWALFCVGFGLIGGAARRRCAAALT